MCGHRPRGIQETLHLPRPVSSPGTTSREQGFPVRLQHKRSMSKRDDENLVREQFPVVATLRSAMVSCHIGRRIHGFQLTSENSKSDVYLGLPQSVFFIHKRLYPGPGQRPQGGKDSGVITCLPCVLGYNFQSCIDDSRFTEPLITCGQFFFYALNSFYNSK